MIPEQPIPIIKWHPEPPMSEGQLVDAKWGLINKSQRELAEAALYWFDQARMWQLVAFGRGGES